MRETGLKCISFNGIPRVSPVRKRLSQYAHAQTINGLGALRAHLPSEVTDRLDTTAHR